MNHPMSLSQRADALEEKMAKELDHIVIKSRLYSLAEGRPEPARRRVEFRRDALAAIAGCRQGRQIIISTFRPDVATLGLQGERLWRRILWCAPGSTDG